MRLIVMFDLPMNTNAELKIYRNFFKFLECDGYLRINYSVYSKLCINSDSVNTYQERLKKNVPKKGDVRCLVLTERQYQSIQNLNNSYTLQEDITTIKRTVFIGEMYDEDL